MIHLPIFRSIFFAFKAIKRITRIKITAVTQRQPTRQNNKHYGNQYTVKGSKYLSGNSLPQSQFDLWQAAPRRVFIIYTLFPPVDFNWVCCCQSRWLSRSNRFVYVLLNISSFTSFRVIMVIYEQWNPVYF